MTETWTWTDDPSPENPYRTELHRADHAVGEADSILYHGADWPISEANKRLIAAAPGLLEALRRGVAHVDGGMDYDWVGAAEREIERATGVPTP
jgi:hypothetical protein